MKFYVINPKSRTIETINVNKKKWDYKKIYDYIGINNTFEWVSLDNRGNGLFIDGEGMLKTPYTETEGNIHQTMWYFKIYTAFDYEHTIAGTALLCGTDDEGNTSETTLPKRLVNTIVDWVGDGEFFEPEPPKIYALDDNNNIIERI